MIKAITEFFSIKSSLLDKNDESSIEEIFFLNNQPQRKDRSHRYFNREIFTMRSFIQHVKLLQTQRKSMKKIFNEKIITKAFIERIMLTSSVVNGCVYCQWGHVGIAKGEGLTEKEISSLFNYDFSSVPAHEKPAVLFTYEYVRTKYHPKSEIIRYFKENYSKNEQKALIAIINMIIMGNRAGNTVSAFISRLQGRKSLQSSLLFELIVFIPIGFLMHVMYKLSKFSPQILSNT